MIAIPSAYFGHIFCNLNPNFYYIDSYGNRFGYPFFFYFFLLISSICLEVKGGGRERETERQTETDRDRQRERESGGGVAYDSKTVKYYD